MIIYTANLLKLKEKYKIIVSRSVKEKEYIHSSSDRRPPWRESLTTTSLILSVYCTMNTINGKKECSVQGHANCIRCTR